MRKIFIFSILLLASACTKNKFEEVLQKNSIDITFNNYFNLKSFSDETLVIMGENSSTKQIIKFSIKSLKDNDSRQEIKKTLVRLIAQFQFSMAPYPGQLTTVINCGSKYHPQLKLHSKLSSIISFTNERLVVSVCDEEGHHYQQTSTFYIDAKSNRLIIVDLYQLKNDDSLTSQKLLKKYFSNWNNVPLTEFAQLLKII